MGAYLTYEGAWGAIVFIFCLSLCSLRLSKSRKFEAIDFSILSMGLVYGALFPIVMDQKSEAKIHGQEFLESMRHISYAHPISVMIAACGLIVGWQAVSAKKRSACGQYFSQISTKGLSIWVCVMLSISVITQYLYVYDYGGIFGYFSYNRLIRSGLFDSFERSRFSFLKPFGAFSTLAFLCSWGLLLSGKRGFLNIILFIISLMVAMYVAVAGGGRVSMVTLLAILPFSILIRFGVSYKLWFILYFAMAALGVFGLFWISYFLELKSAENISSYIARESSFVFVSFFANLQGGDFLYLFYEVLIWPAFLIPSSLTNSWLFSATDLNTMLIYGSAKGADGITGSIPTDIITFGFMQLHFIGVFLYPVILGYFLRIVSELSYSFRDAGLSSAFTSYVMLKVGVFAIFYSYPKHLIMSHFGILAALMVIFMLRLMRRFSKRY